MSTCVYLSKLYCRILSEREEKLMDLEMCCQRLADNSVDKEALLDSMQSDKTALSRAIAQNKELKTQLAELQNGFVKMVSFCKELRTKVVQFFFFFFFCEVILLFAFAGIFFLLLQYFNWKLSNIKRLLRGIFPLCKLIHTGREFEAWTSTNACRHVCEYMDQKGSAAMLTSIQTAGVAPEVNLRITQVRKHAKRDPPWLWNPGQMSPEVQNRGISGPTNKDLCPPKIFLKKFHTTVFPSE